jgi:hypothetical protein
MNIIYYSLINSNFADIMIGGKYGVDAVRHDTTTIK